MRTLTRGWRVAAGIAFAAIVVSVAAAVVTPVKPVRPAIDLLEQPSPMTARGERKLLLDVANAGARLVAVGEFGVILLSDDAGLHWKQADSPTSVMLTAVTFVNAATGWAVGHDGVILATADGGLHWQRQFDGKTANVQILDAARKRVEVAQALKGGDEKSLRQREQSEDRLADAEAAVQAGPSRPLLGVRFINSDKGFAVGAFGQLFQTENAGKQWHYIGDRLVNGEGLHLNGISISPWGDLFIAAESGVVYRSSDQGQTWARTETGYTGQIFGVLAAQSDGKQFELAYGFAGHMFRSEDGGLHWNKLTNPLQKTVVQGVPASDGCLLFASQDGQMALFSERTGQFEVFDARAKLQKLSGFTLTSDGHGLIAVGLGGAYLSNLFTGGAKP